MQLSLLSLGAGCLELSKQIAAPIDRYHLPSVCTLPVSISVVGLRVLVYLGRQVISDVSHILNRVLYYYGDVRAHGQGHGGTEGCSLGGRAGWGRRGIHEG